MTGYGQVRVQKRAVEGNDPSLTRLWPPHGSLPSTACFCTQTCPYPVTLLPIGSGYFEAKPFPVQIPQNFSNLFILHTYLPMKMEQSVLKRRHIKFRRRGITQKKAYHKVCAVITFSYLITLTAIIKPYVHCLSCVFMIYVVCGAEF